MGFYLMCACILYTKYFFYMVILIHGILYAGATIDIGIRNYRLRSFYMFLSKRTFFLSPIFVLLHARQRGNIFFFRGFTIQFEVEMKL